MNNGAFGENFPYSNFHDLNMDWIIKIAKDFLDQYTHIQEIISTGETELDNIVTTGLEQLQTKASELEELLNQWYNTHSEDIAHELADAISSINIAEINSIATFNQQAEEKARDVIQTIPSDYTTVANKVETILPHLFPSFYPQGYIPMYGVNGNTGDISSSSTYKVSYDVRVAPNSKLSVYNYSDSTHEFFGVAVYDEAGTFLTGKVYDTLNGVTVDIPYNGYIAKITCRNGYEDKLWCVYEVENWIGEKISAFTTGRNLFNKTAIIPERYLNNGTLIFSSTYFTSDYIPVYNPNHYCFNMPLFTVETYDVNKVLVRTLPANNIFYPTTTEKYIRFSNPNTTLDSIQLETTGYSSKYENYEYILKNDRTEDGKLTEEPVNLFNPETITPGYINNGVIRPIEGYYTSQFIAVTPGEYVTASGLFGFLCVYDNQGNYIRGQDSVIVDGKTRSTVFIAPNEALIRFSFAQAYIDQIQVEKNIGYTVQHENLDNPVIQNKLHNNSYQEIFIPVGTDFYFKTINSVLNAITDNSYHKRYVIRLMPGIYNETFTMKDYVDIIGDNKHQCIINYVNPGDDDYVNKSTIFFTANAKLKNLFIATKGTKYPIHMDANYGKPYTAIIEDCIIKHDGFDTPSIEGTGIGIGLHFNQNVIIKNCDIASSGGYGASAVYCHNDDQNNTQAVSKRHRQLEIINCILHNSYSGLRLDCIETVDGQDNDCIYIGNVNTCTNPLTYNPGTFNSWHIYQTINNPAI